MRNFEIRLGWTPLTRALERAEAIVGESAWEEMKAAIRHKRLPARCLADGVTKEFEPQWFDFLASERPEVGDVLWFDREKGIVQGVPLPRRAENIVVKSIRIAELWPNSTEPEEAVRQTGAGFSPTYAVRRVLNVIYGNDLMEALTPAQRDLIDLYPYPAEPIDPQLRVKLKRARELYGLIRKQYDRARQWLKSSGFDMTGGARIGAGALERALASDFGAVRGSRLDDFRCDPQDRFGLTISTDEPKRWGDGATSAREVPISGGSCLASDQPRQDTGNPQLPTHAQSREAPAGTRLPRPRLPNAEVGKWYEGTYIPECQTAGNRPSEATDWAAAKLKFGNKVRRDQIRDLRRALAPDDWRIQGRRPSSTNSAENSAE
jgi:hypothetical protein